jgi:hypothetical protein
MYMGKINLKIIAISESYKVSVSVYFVSEGKVTL